MDMASIVDLIGNTPFLRCTIAQLLCCRGMSCLPINVTSK